eukprot:TRINITY_DN100503_c0_g1_i1.p1 TRINITY_DN100503_c0_g1~~TRINITY_DN100503_c0_g1_i1.p1  ORF type:complete len:194 (-),score=64.43 TRINITY_DN100503_c0_g1_i1:96-677(-)
MAPSSEAEEEETAKAMKELIAKAKLGKKGDEQEASAESEKRYLSNPTVLRAALEIVKRKKEEAVEKEEYQKAAEFQQKIKKLEAQLLVAAEQLDDDEDGDPSSSAGKADDEDVVVTKPKRRSLLSAPNPFRTVDLLKQSGYSTMQAYGMLAFLYMAVFAVELFVLYIGWNFYYKTSGGEDGDDTGFEGHDIEF